MNTKPHWAGRAFLLGLAANILALSVSWGGGPYRTFRDTRNRSFRGALKAFDSSSQMVTIERVDGKTGKMPVDAFSKKDRGYIREWGATRHFMQGLKISVRLQSKQVSVEGARALDVPKRVSDFLYEVTLSNSTTSAMGEIDIEYCIFYRQGERDGNTIEYDEGVCHGQMKAKTLKPSTGASVGTRSVRLYSERGAQTIFGAAEFSDAEIRGIWLRLETRLPSGEILFREFRTAEDPLWEWRDYSVGTGVNKGDRATQFFPK